jgi:hypothetical protein
MSLSTMSLPALGLPETDRAIRAFASPALRKRLRTLVRHDEDVRQVTKTVSLEEEGLRKLQAVYDTWQRESRLTT